MDREEINLREKEKQERIKILKHADNLTKVCDSCEVKKQNSATEQNYYIRLCTECPVYSEYRKIGNSLMALSKERKKRNGIDMVVTARKNLGLKLGFDKVVEDKVVTRNELELDEYYRLKNKGLSDTKIANDFNVDRNVLIRWKKRNDVERIHDVWRPSIPKLNK